MNFDYQKGGEDCGKYFPALKLVHDATVASADCKSVYYHYEPGNMTRYEVIFTRFNTKYETNKVVMTVFCPRNTSMVLPGDEMGMYSINYMQDKLGMSEGDCYALIQLINHYLKATK